MRKLLMIPGPIEISPAVVEATSGAPPSHVAPDFIEAFGHALTAMRKVWLAPDDHQPFAIAGSGTIAMEMAATNLIGPGDRVLLVNTGYFGDRMAKMLRRRGAMVEELRAPAGSAPSVEAARDQLARGGFKALFATHVDTSTGVRVDAQALAELARAHDALSVFDGVCATAGERFDMGAWGADVYLTASQKAIGLPAGLALMVASPRALAARKILAAPPPMSLDFQEWLPIMQAYEARAGSYFSTPATTLVRGLAVGLDEILASRAEGASGVEARFAAHAQAAERLRRVWRVLGLELFAEDALAANTLSAIRYPAGIDTKLVGAISERGVIVAGGLHPEHKNAYFRVGHMGYSITQPEHLERTVSAIAEALAALGHACDVDAARRELAS
ncbi:MAG: aminotransferase class V-fold PLP-dependent enzyme [Polyangiaceae bacterium]